MTIPFKVTKTQLELQDLYIDLDEVTVLTSEQPFKLELKPSLTYEKDDVVQMEITVEMNRDLHFIERKSYTLIDLLSDVGGVQAIFVSFVGAWIALWNYEHFDTTMASQLFKIQADDQDKHSGQTQLFTPTKTGNLKELIIDTLRSFHCGRRRQACRKSRRARMIDRARKQLEKEVNIIDIIKSRRYFVMALRQLLPQKKREELL